MATISIANWVKKTGLSVDQAVRGIKLNLFSGVIRDTRVDTGRLRGNWQTSTGNPISTTIDRLDPSGSSAIAQVAGVITSDKVDYITNNLPYAQVWNERDAIIDRNMARIQQITRIEVQKAKR